MGGGGPPCTKDILSAKSVDIFDDLKCAQI